MWPSCVNVLKSVGGKGTETVLHLKVCGGSCISIVSGLRQTSVLRMGMETNSVLYF